MTASGELPGFSDRYLARRVEMLTEAQVDALPFGAIRLNDAGVVTYYSQAERRLSGSGRRERLGAEFFANIAPCMDNADFKGRIERARAAGTLDIEFSHIGDFDDDARELSVRIQSAADGGYWIFMRRES